MHRAADDALHKQGDVLAATPQRRQADTSDVEAVEQVLTKLALGHAAPDGLIGGRDDAYICSSLSAGSEWPVVVILGEPQQRRLPLGREAMHLV